jgi:2-methylcitrate dehydratase
VLEGRVNDIEKIDIETYYHAVEIAADTPDKWNPTTRETADHSIPYVVAVALTNGTFWFDYLTEEYIRDPQIHALMQKISVRGTDECNKDWPEAYPFRITVTTCSGEQHVREVRYAKGHPKNPFTDHDIEAKFRRLTEPVLDDAQIKMALDRLWHMEELKSVQEMLALFTLRSGSRA